VTVAVPLLADEDTLQIKDEATVSASDALNSAEVQLAVPSSEIVLLKGPAPWLITGASFTAFTVTFTVIVSLIEPSETRTTKLSLPLKFALGA